MRVAVNKLTCLALLAAFTGCTNRADPGTLCLLDCLPKAKIAPRAPPQFILGSPGEIEGGSANEIRGASFTLENSVCGSSDRAALVTGSNFTLQGGSNANE